MGIYSNYLDALKDFQSISAERKSQLQKITQIRNRAILVIASDFTKGDSPIAIDGTDVTAVSDQLAGKSGAGIDFILETPGGFAERAEDIVKLLRDKYTSVAFIIPGAAMSAGTIMVMSGDEILMEPASSLGPIDAQMPHRDGRRFSAEAFLRGLDKIKEEVETTGILNKAYIPILQNISPAEIQACENAQDFSKKLVSQWLANGKFRTWTHHGSTGKPVTDAEKLARAEEIAEKLRDHSNWLTHGRSIKMADLLNMRLQIVDFSTNDQLCDAIRRYYALLRITFETTGIFKLFETIDTQLYRFNQAVMAPMPMPSIPFPLQLPQAQNKMVISAQCRKCGNSFKIQVNFGIESPLEPGCVPFPQDDKLKCTGCGVEQDLSLMRQNLESQFGKKIVS
jgi:hypothetical protein